MTSQASKAEQFHALHVKGDPVVLYNIWDPGSAKAVAEAGAKAIALGSWPVAAAQGFADGQKIPMDIALANAKSIAAATELPVTLDFEGGYALQPEELKSNIAFAIASGIVGFNFEDQIVGGDGLHSIEVQADRVSAVRAAIDESDIPAFLNARTDVFLKNNSDTHDQTMLDEVIERAKVYEAAGASGFFAPGLLDEAMIGKLCEATSLPVNIIAIPGCPEKSVLASLGVARISYGPVPYRKLMAALGEMAAEAFA